MAGPTIEFDVEVSISAARVVQLACWYLVNRNVYVSPTTEEPEKSERPKEIGAKGTVTLFFGRVLP